MEKRLAIRYPVHCPTISRWKVDGGISETCAGLTRDVSMGGVFLVVQACPPVGTSIALTLSIPNLDGTALGLRAIAAGHVTRIEQSDGNVSGFAAAVQFEPHAEDAKVLKQPLLPCQPNPLKKEQIES